MEKKSPSQRFNPNRVTEIHLDRAPVVKVLAQIQFSYTPELITDENEQKLAQALSRYPIRRRNNATRINLNPSTGFVGNEPNIQRIFADSEQSWVVSITETTVSLETRSYSTGDDFCERMFEILLAVSVVCVPPVVDRVGLRYIDRLCDSDDLSRLHNLVEPRLQVLHGSVEPPLEIESSVSDTVIKVTNSEKLRVRSGVLPPNMLFDPFLNPVQEPSWILDLDMFTSKAGYPFEPIDLASKIRNYSEIIYAFFRWATTEEFQNSFKKGTNQGE